MDIKVDISNPIDQFGLSDDDALSMMDVVSRALAGSFMANVEASARMKLNQTRQAYIDGLSMTKITRGSYAVELNGFLPNAVEFGVSSFDMKEGFGRSSKAKRKIGGGWYLTIPFRHANPNAVATSTAFTSVMPNEIYAIARKLQASRGLGVGSIPQAHRGVATNSFGYTHKAPIYAGMRKSTQTNHTTYTSFRRVSDNSDENSWMHSGIPAHNIAKDQLSRIDVGNEAKKAIDEFLTAIGK